MKGQVLGAASSVQPALASPPDCTPHRSPSEMQGRHGYMCAKLGWAHVHGLVLWPCQVGSSARGAVPASGSDLKCWVPVMPCSEVREVMGSMEWGGWPPPSDPGMGNQLAPSRQSCSWKPWLC